MRTTIWEPPGVNSWMVPAVLVVVVLDEGRAVRGDGGGGLRGVLRLCGGQGGEGQRAEGGDGGEVLEREGFHTNRSFGVWVTID